MGICSEQQHTDHPETGKHHTPKNYRGSLIHPNHQLHQVLDLETVHQIAARTTNRYVERLHAHTNTEAIMLLEGLAIQQLRRKTLANIS